MSRFLLLGLTFLLLLTCSANATLASPLSESPFTSTTTVLANDVSIRQVLLSKDKGYLLFGDSDYHSSASIFGHPLSNEENFIVKMNAGLQIEWVFISPANFSTYRIEWYVEVNEFSNGKISILIRDLYDDLARNKLKLLLLSPKGQLLRMEQIDVPKTTNVPNLFVAYPSNTTIHDNQLVISCYTFSHDQESVYSHVLFSYDLLSRQTEIIEKETLKSMSIYPNRKLIALPDSGWLMLGRLTDDKPIFLKRYSSSGQLVWSTFLSNSVLADDAISQYSHELIVDERSERILVGGLDKQNGEGKGFYESYRLNDGHLQWRVVLNSDQLPSLTFDEADGYWVWDKASINNGTLAHISSNGILSQTSYVYNDSDDRVFWGGFNIPHRLFYDSNKAQLLHFSPSPLAIIEIKVPLANSNSCRPASTSDTIAFQAEYNIKLAEKGFHGSFYRLAQKALLQLAPTHPLKTCLSDRFKTVDTTYQAKLLEVEKATLLKQFQQAVKTYIAVPIGRNELRVLSIAERFSDTNAKDVALAQFEAQKELAIQREATKAVERALSTKKSSDISKAKAWIAQLQNETTKQNLLQQLGRP